MSATDKFDDSEHVKTILAELKSGRASIIFIPRDKNNVLFLDYMITHKDRESIVRKLTISDYEESIFNTCSNGQAMDKLHIFMHNEMLTPVDGENKRKVTLYIKLGERATIDPKDNKKVIVVSFHEAEY